MNKRDVAIRRLQEVAFLLGPERNRVGETIGFRIVGVALQSLHKQIDRLDRLTGEVFGPFLHAIRWSSDHLEQVLDAVIATGFGLTLGIHSRIDDTVRRVHERLPIGNSYVNRNMIGAVVGVQPFGGERLSGTGPKAGGPRYLYRFATERTLSTDTTASGGNASLLSLDDGR